MKTLSHISMSVLTAASLLSGGLTALAGNGVEIEHLGTNNTLVRVTGDGKYLILPVQESNDEANVNVIVDGKLDRTLSVRLAKSKVDYTVPLDLKRYAGKKVVLNIITSQGRSSVREAKEDACWNNFTVTDSFDTANREKFRPVYHHTPLYGWMNDPNGMFYKDGVWHLAFQWNPYGSKWQNLSWGQSTSRDLIHWETQPEAVLEPDGLGMIFSGSSAIDRENSAGFGKDAVIAMYTSAAASQIQSLAWSDDGGYTYNVYPGNPVLTLESEARDPNMFWNPETKEWTLVLAHALDHEMLIFTSPDMKEWTLRSSFGKGLGAQDGVWECPDLFELSVKGSGEKKWVLLCNLNPGGIFGGSATQYFVGDFDGRTFTPDLDADGKVPTKWLDYGKDHYATVSFSDAPDGRRTVIGWMSNWQYAPEVPTMQYRSANTLPREMGLFRGNDGQLYVSSTPSPEIEAIRGKVFKAVAGVRVGEKAQRYAIPEICEILMTIDPAKAGSVSIALSNAAGEHVDMVYDVAGGKLSFDRRESGIVDFSQDFPAVTYAPVHSADGKISLRIFIDRSSVEVFEREGRFVMTNLVFPNAPYSTLSVRADGGKAKVSDLRIYTINEK
ncbi:MAG: DUF4980 domain-containing protein [Duncaniella sp.]|uniref:DUF4980 domain-containing protein n=1 Tax=Duncaniella sp. TaxID=2518496 RepID=UPI0023CD6704|nr:DUF4980 domain-containing protein [Duncaniella sp.]MDE5989745.1 DUF4980 domain-containing protein [Duncaniella sp.]MDE6174621.1 DUF4980 domain-containing protein [Duncaniella sp.]